MRKKVQVLSLVGITIALLFSTVYLTHPDEVYAKSKVMPIEGISYNVNATLADNLKSFIGKKVSVTTDSGKTRTGIVKKVGKRMIHLEKLEGKEYFDALIRIENISAIETRFRRYQK